MAGGREKRAGRYHIDMFSPNLSDKKQVRNFNPEEQKGRRHHRSGSGQLRDSTVV